MLDIYSTVHKHVSHKLSSYTSTFQSTQEKQLPLHTFVLHKNFKPVKFSQKLKPLRIGPYKIIKNVSDVTYELLSQDGSTFHTHRNHLIPYYPKEPLIFPHIQKYYSPSDSLIAHSPSHKRSFSIPDSPYINTDNTYSKLRPSALTSKSQKQLSQSQHDISLIPSQKQSFFIPAHDNDDSDDSNSDFDNPLYIPTPLTDGPPIPLTKFLSTSTFRNYSSNYDIPTSCSTPHTSSHFDTQHPLSHQFPLPSSPPRNTRTRYHLRSQPKLDYRTFIPPSKLYPP